MAERQHTAPRPPRLKRMASIGELAAKALARAARIRAEQRREALAFEIEEERRQEMRQAVRYE